MNYKKRPEKNKTEKKVEKVLHTGSGFTGVISDIHAFGVYL